MTKPIPPKSGIVPGPGSPKIAGPRLDRIAAGDVSAFSSGMELLRFAAANPDWRISSGVFYKIMVKSKDDYEGAMVVPFKPNPMQQRLMSDLWHRNIILKARQLGFTTLVSILWLDHALWVSNQRCGIIAHDRESAEIIFRDKVKFAYDNLPAELRTFFPLAKDSANELLFKHNNSSIRVATSLRSGTIHRLHVCLAGDTEILLRNGLSKRIKDIVPGDEVMTGKGSYLPVQHLIKNRLEDVAEPILSLKTHGWYQPLKLTANHKVLTRTFKTGEPAWKPAGEIEPGDYIAFPIREISNKLRSKSLPFGPQTYTKLPDGSRGPNVGKRITVDYELGVLVGMYLAEGHVRRTETSFALHRGEEVEWFVSLLEQFSDFYTSYRVYDHKDSLTTQVVVNSGEFADFLTTYFGDVEDKVIPDAVWGYGRKFADGLIFGYFQGDGCFTNPREVQITSIRPQLIRQIRTLLISTRFGVPSVYHRAAGKYYGRNCKETWVLKLHGPANWKFRKYFGLSLPEVNTQIGKIALDIGRNPIGRKNWRRGKDYYWARITSVDIAEDEPFVYDLVLPEDPHNYVTANGIVHNSEFGKICAKYPDKAQEVITGSIPAVPMGGLTMIESTAEGQAGAFYNMTMKAKDHDAMGRRDVLTSREYRFHFFPWWDNPEYVLDEEGVIIGESDRKYFDDLESSEGIQLTDAQKRWYVATRDADYSESPELMWQEFPSSAMEAFQQSVEGCYYSKQLLDARRQGRITKVPTLNAPVNTFWDIGKRDLTAIWFHQQTAMEHRFIHYYEVAEEDLLHLMRYLQQTGFVFGTHYLPHDAFHGRLNEGNKSVTDMLRQMGLRNIQKVPRIDNVLTGIQQTRDVFPLCWFDDEGCKDGLARLQQYRKRWNKQLGCWSQEPLHDEASNGADAFRQFGQVYAASRLHIRAPKARKPQRSSWKVA